MRRHVTANFIIGYISVKPENKGDETVSKSNRNIILVVQNGVFCLPYFLDERN